MDLAFSDVPQTIVEGTGRVPRHGDAVVLQFIVRFASPAPAVAPLLESDGVIYVLGASSPDGLPAQSVISAALQRMREGSAVKLCGALAAGACRGAANVTDLPTGVLLEWEIHLSALCAPGGSSLARRDPTERGGLRSVVRRSAAELQERGITALCGPERGGLTKREVTMLLDKSLAFFHQALGRVGEEIAQDAGLVIRYRDCVARRSHRMHVKPPEFWEDEAFGFLHRNGAFHEVLRLAFGTSRFRLTHCGTLMAKPAVEALPNNVNQAWHRDAPQEQELGAERATYAAVAYIPLVDLDGRCGVTEFFVGSHRQEVACEELDTMPPPQERLRSTEGLKAGDVVLFDLRLCHRGLLHTAPDRGVGELGVRPVVALNFGVEVWEDREDDHNWGTSYLVSGPHGR